MSREIVKTICLTLPGAEVNDPWGGGHDAWKVGGKMFASIGMLDDGVSVKTADVESAEMLIDAGIAVRARYFHKSWVHIPWGADEDELKARVAASYELIKSKLPKRVQAELGR